MEQESGRSGAMDSARPTGEAPMGIREESDEPDVPQVRSDAGAPVTTAAGPLPPEPFTMATRMCDDDGLVSATVAADMQGLANPELQRLTYLDKVNNMRRHTGLRPVEPFRCTGSAHLAGEHIRCTSPAHGKQPEYDQQSGWTSA